MKITQKIETGISLIQLFKRLLAYIKPYKKLVFGTLILTLIGSFMAQVNALVLRYTVDELSILSEGGATLEDGWNLLIFISVILLSKELLNTFIQYGQKYYGEKMRIYISRDFAQEIVDKILTYKMAFYSSSENESGKLQTRIDQGISSLTQLVRIFFIDILPLFSIAIIALVFMFQANVYIGLVSLAIIPLFFSITKLNP